MVKAVFEPSFEKAFSKMRDNALKERIIKHFEKIRDNPKIGKPMRYGRKGTREVYIPPFRLSYMYIQSEEKIVFLGLYHKDEQ